MLLSAARTGRRDMLERLLDGGLSVNHHGGEEHKSALILAAENGHSEVSMTYYVLPSIL